MPVGSAELRGLRILVVEDEFLVALELESMLKELGGDVIGPLGSVDQAVPIAHEEALDLALLDVNVGGRLITPVADALAARGIPFAFCTGYDAAGLPDRHAAAPILTKPCQVRELKSALLKSLRGRTAPGRASRPPSPMGAGAGTRPMTGTGRPRRAERHPRD